jgi:hypothetical protein
LNQTDIDRGRQSAGLRSKGGSRWLGVRGKRAVRRGWNQGRRRPVRRLAAAVGPLGEVRGPRKNPQRIILTAIAHNQTHSTPT